MTFQIPGHINLVVLGVAVSVVAHAGLIAGPRMAG